MSSGVCVCVCVREAAEPFAARLKGLHLLPGNIVKDHIDGLTD